MIVALAVAAVAPATRTGRLRAQEPAPAARPPAASGPIDVSDPLRSPPFDRLTLIDGAVLIIDPVSPRPLPPVEPPKSKNKVRLKGSKTEIPLEGNIGLPGEPSKFRTPGEERTEDQSEEEKNSIKVHLLQEAEVRDFTLKRSNIKSIEYFEDILLAEGDRLVLAREFARAFECFLRVKSRNPGWAGLADHVNRLLYAEGSAALIVGDHERGLRLLRELLERNRNFPGLLDRIASAYGGWIARAIDLKRFTKGRRFLHELEEMAPEHPVVRDLRNRFIAHAGEHVKQAEAHTGAERLDELVEAVRVWPEHQAARTLYQRAFEEVPTLDVAVCDVPRPLGPWQRSPADARVTGLLYWPILAGDSDEARAGKAPDSLSRDWSPPISAGGSASACATVSCGPTGRARSPRPTSPAHSSTGAIRIRRSFRRAGPSCSIASRRPRTTGSRSGSITRSSSWATGSTGLSARHTAGSTAGWPRWTRVGGWSATAPSRVPRRPIGSSTCAAARGSRAPRRTR